MSAGYVCVVNGLLRTCDAMLIYGWWQLLVVDGKANVDATGFNGWTPVMYAADDGDVNCLQVSVCVSMLVAMENG